MKLAILRPGSTISLSGNIVKKFKGEGVEVQMSGSSDLITYSIAAPLPITQNSGRAEQIDNRHVSLRYTPDQLAFRVQSSVIAAAHDFWDKNDFTILTTPKIVGAASESGSEVFELDYFGRPAYLAQSPQFYKQMAMAGGVRAFAEIGPVFRAEPSDTPRHLAEFSMVDMEVAWIEENHRHLMTLEETFLRDIFNKVNDKHGDAIKKVFNASLELPNEPFPRITHAEAREILSGKGIHLAENEDIRTEAERVLGDYFMKQDGHPFYFVEEYPVDARVFYHQRPAGKPNLTKSFDLMFKGVEITTGAIREHRPDVLKAQAEEKVPGLSVEPGMQNYFKSFEHGCPPHGGFAIGLGRLVQKMLDRPSIQDVTYLPRTMQRLTP